MANADPNKAFLESIQKGYPEDGDCLYLGAAMLAGEVLSEAAIQLPLKNFNRHGLIAGATGTGKTKTLQIVAEQLSRLGVPSLVMDIKGDLSGLGAAGTAEDFIVKRHAKLGVKYEPGASPLEFLSLSDEPGARLRATITEFGPILMSRILDLNETQTGVLSVVFKFCDDSGLLLLDLKDLKKAVHFVANEGADDIAAEYGSISKSSASTILRKIVALEQQGAEHFFGEQSYEIDDLLRCDKDGRGIISVVRLTDMQSKPALFSTFMLQLFAEAYERLPEEGDLAKPKLCIFIDEAHLVFKNASRALLEQIEVMVKLIRSKGVGIYFITQNPTDVPGPVLSQLGLKVQHALRAFTAKDRRAIKQTAENFPLSKFYETDRVLTEMGIGEALVTGLGPKGRPTPLAWTYMRAPASRMDVLSEAEIQKILKASAILKKYNQVIDRESAYEILTAKIEALESNAGEAATKKASKKKASGRKEKSTLEKVLDSSAARQVGRTLAREITRGLLGVIGIKRR
ncbi:MAG: DUF853 family protein [Leptospiraceae bacterium]|nr:DUF853 family protein [Leptospiraceae bacterium]